MIQENDFNSVKRQLQELRYEYYSFRISMFYRTLIIAVCFVLGLAVGCLI
jgi:hypothetical protein|nr:MAG TPA: hypothetical protein [Caudoviricetes sp.]